MTKHTLKVLRFGHLTTLCMERLNSSYYKLGHLFLLQIGEDGYYKSDQLSLLQIGARSLQTGTDLLQIGVIATNRYAADVIGDIHLLGAKAMTNFK